jgi:hypothetical protein
MEAEEQISENSTKDRQGRDGARENPFGWNNGDKDPESFWIQAGSGQENVFPFIYPSTLQVIDGLVTNFHLPSTLMLARLRKKDLLMKAYQRWTRTGFTAMAMPC